MRDVNRAKVYDTERMAHRLMERANGNAHTVQIAGATLTVPPEARFGDVDGVRRYVDRVVNLPAVRARFPAAATPVAVRRRRGGRAAHYERESAVIAVPDAADGAWALRELVILHEIAHHLDSKHRDSKHRDSNHRDPDSDSQVHGPSFVNTLIELVGLVLGPETGLVYRVLFTEAGVC